KRWVSFARWFSLPETVILEIADNLLTKVQDVALHRQAGAVLVASCDGPGDGLMLVDVEDLGVNVACDRQAHVLPGKGAFHVPDRRQEPLVAARPLKHSVELADGELKLYDRWHGRIAQTLKPACQINDPRLRSGELELKARVRS